MIKKCVICQKEFASYRGIAKVCSQGCRKELDKRNCKKYRDKPDYKDKRQKYAIENSNFIKQSKKESYEKNKVIILEKQKEYRHKPEKKQRMKEWSRQHREKNKDKISAEKKEKYVSLKNKSEEERKRVLNVCRQYRQRPDYKEKKQRWADKYYSTEKGKLTSIKRTQNRRARELNIINNLSRQDLLEIKNKYAYCVYCLGQDRLAYEHIISVAKKGGNIKENIIRACIHCNGSKKDLPLDEWLATFYCISKNIKKEEIMNRIMNGC